MTYMVYNWFAAPVGPPAGALPWSQPLVENVSWACPDGETADGNSCWSCQSDPPEAKCEGAWLCQQDEFAIGTECYTCQSADHNTCTPVRRAVFGCVPTQDMQGCTVVGDLVNRPMLQYEVILDPDGDGKEWPADLCPYVPHDGPDPDADGDGVGDDCDNCPLDPNADQLDANGNNIGDLCEGVCPQAPTCAPAATGGVPLFLPCTKDSDCTGISAAGLPNRCFQRFDPRDPAAIPLGARCGAAADADADGWPDACDNCIRVRNGGQQDQDCDGLGDACDNCLQTVNVVPCGYDLDCADDGSQRCQYNGVCEGQYDQDVDGVGDECDNCPFKANAGIVTQQTLASDVPWAKQKQIDSDGDGLGDACDYCSHDASYPTAACATDVDCGGGNNPLDANQERKNWQASRYCVPIFHPATDPPRMKPGVCAQDPTVYDADGDGHGLGCDNCPVTPNADQANCNSDQEVVGGLTPAGDACDPTPCATMLSPHGFALSKADVNAGIQEVVTIPLSPNVLAMPPGYVGSAPKSVAVQMAYCDACGGNLFPALTCKNMCRIGTTYYPPKTGASTGEWKFPVVSEKNIPDGAAKYPAASYDHAFFSDLLPVTPVPAKGATAPPAPKGFAFGAGVASKSIYWNIQQTLDYANPAAADTEIAAVLWSHVNSIDVKVGKGGLGQSVPKSAYAYANSYVSKTFGGAISSIAVTGHFGDHGGGCSIGPKNGCPIATGPHIPGALGGIFPSVLGQTGEAPWILVDTSPPVGEPAVFARTARADVGLDGALPLELQGALLDTDARWMDASEGPVLAAGAPVTFVAMSTDGTTLSHALGFRTDGSFRDVREPLIIGGGPRDPPSPRVGFGAAFSALRSAVFVAGGTNLDGSFPKDVWRYDILNDEWVKLPARGPAPGQVLAMTYRHANGSLYILDRQPNGVRLLRVSSDTGEASVVLAASCLFDDSGWFLSSDEAGRLIVARTSASKHRYRATIFDVGADGAPTRAVAFFGGEGTLEMPIVAGIAGYTVSVFSKKQTVENVLLDPAQFLYPPFPIPLPIALLLDDVGLP